VKDNERPKRPYNHIVKSIYRVVEAGPGGELRINGKWYREIMKEIIRIV
jgi:hypothetical protein